MKDPVETGPIDTSAFDAAMRAEKQQLPVDDTAANPLADTAADPLADTNPNIPNPSIPTQAAMRPIDTPPVRRAEGTPKRRTTYYNGEADPKDRVYQKAVQGKTRLIIALVVIIVAALIGGGVWYFTNSHKADENLIMAEKYMDRGNFDKALGITRRHRRKPGPGGSGCDHSADQGLSVCRGLCGQRPVHRGHCGAQAAARTVLPTRIPRCTRPSRICSIRRSLPSRTISSTPIWTRHRAIWTIKVRCRQRQAGFSGK